MRVCSRFRGRTSCRSAGGRSRADFYDEEVDVAVSALLSLMEPAIIAILGLMVGGMVVARYLPVFDMMNAVQ
jgi:type IV pilus assembly protein PilC